MACQQCHKKEFVSQEEVRTFQVKDPDRTFLGLSQRCLTCHEDEHRGQLGANCETCHSFEAWKP
ncbi:MAG TPA: cytochrome c3 family protein, partial [Terriglobia bacterium]